VLDDIETMSSRFVITPIVGDAASIPVAPCPGVDQIFTVP
jgi:hypothetical protein